MIAEVTDIELQLRGPLARAWDLECKRRGVKPAELLADIIEHTINDNLFAAILDNGE